MIHFAEIRDSLVDLIKERAGLNLKVYFNHVNDASVDYCQVRLRPSRTDWGDGWINRDIRVDFQFTLHPNGFAEQHHMDYYEIVDALDLATLNAVPIADRWITIYECSSRIFDGSLTYSFMLSFSDCWDELPEAERAELMKHLHLDLNGR